MHNLTVHKTSKGGKLKGWNRSSVIYLYMIKSKGKLFFFSVIQQLFWVVFKYGQMNSTSYYRNSVSI